MIKPICQVKDCDNKALIQYGSKWICGDCYMKIHIKKIEQQSKDIEDLSCQ